jgi:YHS domain-containing protein
MKLKTSIVFAAALLMLGTLFVVGCNSTKTDAPAEQGTNSNSGKQMPDMSPEEHENMGETVAFTNEKGELVCPVQGDVIPSPEKAAGFQDYKGKRYYFCCAGCPEAFAADPEKYAK